jgi:hypothetical protein
VYTNHALEGTQHGGDRVSLSCRVIRDHIESFPPPTTTTQKGFEQQPNNKKMREKIIIRNDVVT